MDENEFYENVRQFHRLLGSAKSNISNVEHLGPALIAPIENELRETPEAACEEGCSYCCHLRAEAFGFELAAIWLFINRAKSPEAVKTIKQKILAQYMLVQALSTEEHFKTNVECPLLENDRCSIYPVRPISCAGHHSCSVESCRKSFENPGITGTEAGGIPTAMNVKRIQTLQFSVVNQVMTANQREEIHHEFISGLHHVSQNPSSIQRWKAGKLISG